MGEDGGGWGVEGWKGDWVERRDKTEKGGFGGSAMRLEVGYAYWHE